MECNGIQCKCFLDNITFDWCCHDVANPLTQLSSLSMRYSSTVMSSFSGRRRNLFAITMSLPPMALHCEQQC